MTIKGFQAAYRCSLPFIPQLLIHDILHEGFQVEASPIVLHIRMQLNFDRRKFCRGKGPKRSIGSLGQLMNNLSTGRSGSQGVSLPLMVLIPSTSLRAMHRYWLHAAAPWRSCL